MLVCHDDGPLYNRTVVYLAPSNSIKHQTKDNNRREHHNGPIHRDGCDGESRGKERKGNRDGQKADRNDVNVQPSGAEPPRAPADIIALDPLDEEENNRNYIRREKAGDRQRHNSVEGDGRTDVDEADESGDNGAENN